MAGIINLNDLVPSPPSGAVNGKWFADPPPTDPAVPRNVSVHVNQTDVIGYGTDTGAANAYVITIALNAALTAGLAVAFIAVHANTAASTLNVNSLGAKTIKKKGSTDLASGDIAAGQLVIAVYDGTYFQIASIGGSSSGSGTVTDTGGLANHGVVIGDATAHDVKSLGTGTAGQYLRSGGSSADPAMATIQESEVQNLVSDLAAKAPLASPALTGTPTAPTPATSDNSTTIPTTAFVKSAIGSSSYLPTSVQHGELGIIINGGAAPPSTGSKKYLRVPYACTITGWVMIADQSGSAQITVKKCAYSAFPTTSSIVASAPPTLTSAQKNTSSTLTGWTTTLSEGDILEFNLDSVTSCIWISLILQVTRS